MLVGVYSHHIAMRPPRWCVDPCINMVCCECDGGGARSAVYYFDERNLAAQKRATRRRRRRQRHRRQRREVDARATPRCTRAANTNEKVFGGNRIKSLYTGFALVRDPRMNGMWYCVV